MPGPTQSDLGLGLQLPWAVPPEVQALAPSMFKWKRERGEQILTRFAALASAPAGTVHTLSSEDLRQGLITALFHAERDAAAAGLSIGIDTPLGPGYVIGAAAVKARANPNAPGAAEYLATHAAVQAALDASSAAPANAVPDLDPAQHVAFPIFAVGVIVVLLGLITATAFVGVAYVRAPSDALARVALESRDPAIAAAAAAALAHEQQNRAPSLGIGLGAGLALALAGGAAILLLSSSKR